MKRARLLIDYGGARAGALILVPPHMRAKYIALGLIEGEPGEDTRTTAELRDALRGLGLPTTGRKHVLLERLQAAEREG